MTGLVQMQKNLMRKLYTFLAILLISVYSVLSLAAKPMIADEEAENTADARSRYMALRRHSLRGSGFDITAARRQAYDQFHRSIAKSTQSSSTIWQSIGPAPITGGQTPTSNPTREPVTGRIASIAIDATDNAVYIGAAQGGVWRSTNKGASWTPLSDDLASLAIGSIAIDPQVHTTLYIGTGEGNLGCDSYSGIGIYKSTDSGQHWNGPFGSSEFNGVSVTSLVVDRTDSDRIIAGSVYGVAGTSCIYPLNTPTIGIYKSDDGGQTWSLVQSGGVSRIVQDPNVATRFWAAMSYYNGVGLYRSDDSGSNWTRASGPGTDLPITAGVRAWITAADNGGGTTTLYYATATLSGTLYKSTDGGSNWSSVNAASGFCSGQCFYDMPVYAEPGNPNTVYTGGAGTSDEIPSSFMRSADGGDNFEDHMRSVDNSSALHADIHDITTWPGTPSEVWVVNDGGVWYSSDKGDHWSNANSNLSITQFSACDLHPSDASIAYGGTQDNGTNSWLGNISWTHSDDGDGGFSLIDQYDPRNVTHTFFNQTGNMIGTAVAQSGAMSTPDEYVFVGAYLLQNNGIDVNDDVLFYAPMHLDRGVSNTLYFGTDKLYKASDFFNTAMAAGLTTPVFSALNNGVAIVPDDGAISAIETIANLATEASTIFTGSSNGHVYRSTDSGASFQEVDALPSVIDLFISDILVDPNNTQIVYQSRAGFTGSTPAHNLRKSTDGGSTWHDASTGLPDIPVNAIAFDPNSTATLWAGTDIGMYRSTDNGATWSAYANGMPNVAIFDIKSNTTTNTLLACTHGRGAFILSDNIFSDGFDG